MSKSCSKHATFINTLRRHFSISDIKRLSSTCSKFSNMLTVRYVDTFRCLFVIKRFSPSMMHFSDFNYSIFGKSQGIELQLNLLCATNVYRNLFRKYFLGENNILDGLIKRQVYLSLKLMRRFITNYLW